MKNNLDKAGYIKQLDVWLTKGYMSPMLRRAINDTRNALDAGDLNLAYQLTACKSFIVGTLRARANTRKGGVGSHRQYFRESNRLNTKVLGNDLYSLLDGMHHNLAWAIEALPSGMVVLSRGPKGKGIVMEHMAHTGTHPVIACMQKEDAEIKAECAIWAQKS